VNQSQSSQSSPRYTAPPGVKHHNAKLTDAKVRRIRKLREERGLTYRELADMFGISWQYAWRLCAGRAWKHVA
jgi:hypothetical protein